MQKTQIILHIAVGTLTASALSANTVLYLENFSNLAEFNRPATETGWKGFWTGGSPSAAHNLAELADPEGVRRNSPLGNPEGVNNNPVPGAEVGVVFWSPTSIQNVTIATQEYAGAIQSSQLGAFSWDFSLDAPSDFDGQLLKRALVQVGGNASDTDNWYVSDPFIVVDTAAFDDGGPPNSFYVGLWDTATVSATGDWIRMPSYDYANQTLAWPGSGSPKTEADFAGFTDYTFYKGPLPDGIVHGFGIHMDNRVGGNFWMDNYTITAIPEPRVFALLAGLSAFGLVWLRRRKR
ncbi:MAG: hypothetical protein JJU00_01100 [Opitutales bacterium]|nr:hypothetical protein [Opitutales bacterium]